MKGWKIYWAVIGIVVLVGWICITFNVLSISETGKLSLDVWTVGCLLGYTIIGNKDNGTERR